MKRALLIILVAISPWLRGDCVPSCNNHCTARRLDDYGATWQPTINSDSHNTWVCRVSVSWDDTAAATSDTINDAGFRCYPTHDVTVQLSLDGGTTIDESIDCTTGRLCLTFGTSTSENVIGFGADAINDSCAQGGPIQNLIPPGYFEQMQIVFVGDNTMLPDASKPEPATWASLQSHMMNVQATISAQNEPDTLCDVVNPGFPSEQPQGAGFTDYKLTAP